MQSCVRRRLAKRELVALKKEAQSVSKYKEKSGQLEKKVFELSSALQKRTADWKDLQQQVTALKQQLEQWTSKHNEIVAVREEQDKLLARPTVPRNQFDELLQAKQDVEARFADAAKSILDRNQEISRLTHALDLNSQDLQERQQAVDSAVARSLEDTASVNALREEVALLKDQLNRANALQSLTRNARAEPPLSPTQAGNGGLRAFEHGVPENLGKSPQRRRGRRHSAAGVAHDGFRDSLDERMILGKSEANGGDRRKTMAVAQPEESRLRDSNGHPVSYANPAEELLRLLEHQESLDEEVLNGLIRDLRIVAPSLNNPPEYNEVMFPANLISTITNEMWKFGMIEESERFLANVMQEIQRHVMVSGHNMYCNLRSLTIRTVSRASKAKMPSYQGSIGSPMFTRYSRSSARPRPMHWTALALSEAKMVKHTAAPFLGQATSDWSPLSSMTWTASSTTST